MRNDAILLLGPTGSGKTPLGDCLEVHGLGGRRCAHMDFGAQLRQAAGHGSPGLSSEDIAFIRGVLQGGALLEDDTFYIARILLNNFMAARHLTARDLIVLNGLPRHTGQARDTDTLLQVVHVVALECTAETVHARIAGNRGGDRTGRTDDSITEIERKLKTYADRTRPLLEHYRAAGVPCRLVPVGVNTGPAEILQELEKQT